MTWYCRVKATFLPRAWIELEVSIEFECLRHKIDIGRFYTESQILSSDVKLSLKNSCDSVKSGRPKKTLNLRIFIEASL